MLTIAVPDSVRYGISIRAGLDHGEIERVGYHKQHLERLDQQDEEGEAHDCCDIL